MTDEEILARIGRELATLTTRLGLASLSVKAWAGEKDLVDPLQEPGVILIEGTINGLMPDPIRGVGRLLMVGEPILDALGCPADPAGCAAYVFRKEMAGVLVKATRLRPVT